jgi:hypothetical protein
VRDRRLKFHEQRDNLLVFVLKKGKFHTPGLALSPSANGERLAA